MFGATSAKLRFIQTVGELNDKFLYKKYIRIYKCLYVSLFRKKLLETVEFIKKCVNVPQISQQSKMPAIQCQKEVIVDVQEKEKHKMLNNLPKVGVCELIYVVVFFA